MRVVSLACAHCGAQMHVERRGGTVSLELVEAIRTGTAQTAAELDATPAGQGVDARRCYRLRERCQSDSRADSPE